MIKLMVHKPTRGDWRGVNEALGIEKPDLCVILGDFGYQPKLDTRGIPYPTEESYWYMTDGISSGTLVLFIDGPLDDYEELESQGSRNKSMIQVYERCMYIPRGSTLQLKTGHDLLFLGGDRTSITEKEVRRAESAGRVDVVLSYASPPHFITIPKPSIGWYHGALMKRDYEIIEFGRRNSGEKICIRHRD